MYWWSLRSSFKVYFTQQTSSVSFSRIDVDVFMSGDIGCITIITVLGAPPHLEVSSILYNTHYSTEYMAI